MRRLVTKALLTIAALGLCQAHGAEVTLRVHHFLPPPSTTHKLFIEPWAEQVEADSQGRIEIEIYPAMQLGGKPPQLYSQVRDGVADIVWTLPGYTPGRFPIVEVFELPFMAATAEATSQAAQEFSEKYLQEEFQDVHPLLFHVHAPGALHMRDKPVQSLDDMKGLKIRAPSRTTNTTLETLGATPVGMPVPAVPEALSKGVVDGALLPYEVSRPLRVHELTDSHTEFGGDRGLYTAVFLFAMNKAKYQALPDDLKKVIDDNSGMALAEKIGPIWDQAETGGRQAAEALGDTFFVIDGAELERWKTAAEPVTQGWIQEMNEKGMDGKMLVEEAKSLVEKYSKQ